MAGAGARKLYRAALGERWNERGELFVGESGKLVRDRIPEIIRQNGLAPEVYQASDEEYRRRLRAKLSEEVEEFLQADEASALDELADVLEVVLALAADLGVDEAELRTAAAEKAVKRGAFRDRWVWMGNTGTASIRA